MPDNIFNNITAVIVIYNSGESFRARLEALLPQVDHVVIVDNHSDQITIALLQALAEEYSSQITLILNNDNLGLGKAQNQGIEQAYKQGFDWLLLMDDDSTPATDMIDRMAHYYRVNPDNEQVGIIAPLIADDHCPDKRYYCLQRKAGLLFKRTPLHEYEYLTDVLNIIASGSLIRREIFEQIGLMREDFFIDYIDCEFCTRMIAAGHSIMTVRDAVLYHRLGQRTRHNFLGKTLFATNHTPQRRYRIARNRLIFWRLYAFRACFPCVLYHIVVAGYELLLVVLFEKQRWLKVRMIFKGLWDGIRTRGIRTPPPALISS